MFFLIAVVASGGGIVLTGLISICLYRCTRKCINGHVLHMAYSFNILIDEINAQLDSLMFLSSQESQRQRGKDVSDYILSAYYL